MKHSIDFSGLPISIDMAFYAAQHLAEWVATYPQQVSAGCLLYLAATKLLASVRRSK